MLFGNEDERDRYFALIEEDPRRVEYGAAMHHAETVSLGIWGSREELARDCARVMAVEVRKFALSLHPSLRVPQLKITTEKVLATQAFRKAFAGARREPEGQLAGALSFFANEAGNDALRREADYHRRTFCSAAPSRPVMPHVAIYSELSGN